MRPASWCSTSLMQDTGWCLFQDSAARNMQNEHAHGCWAIRVLVHQSPEVKCLLFHSVLIMDPGMPKCIFVNFAHQRLDRSNSNSALIQESAFIAHDQHPVSIYHHRAVALLLQSICLDQCTCLGQLSQSAVLISHKSALIVTV